MVSRFFYALALVGVLAASGWFIITQMDAEGIFVEPAKRFYEEDSHLFPDGSINTFLTPIKPKTEVPTEKVEKTIQEVNEEGELVNKTVVVEEPIEDYTSLQLGSGIPKFSKTDPNGVRIEGYLKLMNSVTNQPVKPYAYNVRLLITCPVVEVGFDYCNLTPIGRNILTEDGGVDDNGVQRGGYYLWIWHPHNSIQEGLYDVKMIFSSANKNFENDRYETFEDTYTIRIIS